jgi:hypothetical protein
MPTPRSRYSLPQRLHWSCLVRFNGASVHCAAHRDRLPSNLRRSGAGIPHRWRLVLLHNILEALADEPDVWHHNACRTSGLYDPASQVGLLTVGIVNAVSSGLLLYAGLVQLLAEDFLSDASYVELQGKRRLQACGAVVAGSMLMAFVGAFA